MTKRGRGSLISPHDYFAETSTGSTASANLSSSPPNIRAATDHPSTCTGPATRSDDLDGLMEPTPPAEPSPMISERRAAEIAIPTIAAAASTAEAPREPVCGGGVTAGTQIAAADHGLTPGHPPSGELEASPPHVKCPSSRISHAKTSPGEPLGLPGLSEEAGSCSNSEGRSKPVSAPTKEPAGGSPGDVHSGTRAVCTSTGAGSSTGGCRVSNTRLSASTSSPASSSTFCPASTNSNLGGLSLLQGHPSSVLRAGAHSFTPGHKLQAEGKQSSKAQHIAGLPDGDEAVNEATASGESNGCQEPRVTPGAVAESEPWPHGGSQLLSLHQEVGNRQPEGVHGRQGVEEGGESRGGHGQKGGAAPLGLQARGQGGALAGLVPGRGPKGPGKEVVPPEGSELQPAADSAAPGAAGEGQGGALGRGGHGGAVLRDLTASGGDAAVRDLAAGRQGSTRGECLLEDLGLTESTPRSAAVEPSSVRPLPVGSAGARGTLPPSHPGGGRSKPRMGAPSPRHASCSNTSPRSPPGSWQSSQIPQSLQSLRNSTQPHTRGQGTGKHHGGGLWGPGGDLRAAGNGRNVAGTPAESQAIAAGGGWPGGIRGAGPGAEGAEPQGWGGESHRREPHDHPWSEAEPARGRHSTELGGGHPPPRPSCQDGPWAAGRGEGGRRELEPGRTDTRRQHSTDAWKVGPHSVTGHAPRGDAMYMAARLAQGHAPWNMPSLQSAIHLAGVSEVAGILQHVNFRLHNPPAALTSLLKQCKAGREWEKAQEVFRGMTQHLAVAPNTVHYSTLIHVCGTAGRWREALQVFDEMKARARNGAQCAPNFITYSVLISACRRSHRPDLANQVLEEAQSLGIDPGGQHQAALAFHTEAFNLAADPYSGGRNHGGCEGLSAEDSGAPGGRDAREWGWEPLQGTGKDFARVGSRPDGRASGMVRHLYPEPSEAHGWGDGEWEPRQLGDGAHEWNAPAGERSNGWQGFDGWGTEPSLESGERWADYNSGCQEGGGAGGWAQEDQDKEWMEEWARGGVKKPGPSSRNPQALGPGKSQGWQQGVSTHDLDGAPHTWAPPDEHVPEDIPENIPEDGPWDLLAMQQAYRKRNTKAARRSRHYSGGCIQLQSYADNNIPERAIDWEGAPVDGGLPLKEECVQATERFDKTEYIEIYLEGVAEIIDSGIPRYPQ